MANKTYPNHVLENKFEDQYASKLDLMQFCTVDDSLTGVAGDKVIINTYTATSGTETLAMGEGNTKSIEVSYRPEEYRILLAQNRFEYFDEQAMKDPNLVPVGMKHAGTDMFNTINADIFAEFNKTGVEVPATALDFGAFADAVASLNIENIEGVTIFAFVCPKDVAKLRKALKEDLKYVEAFVKNGYVGTVAGINLYTKKDAVPGTIVIGTKEAVTLFNKKGTEVEQPPRDSEDANIRKNTILSRKYYLVALTDATKAVKITIAA